MNSSAISSTRLSKPVRVFIILGVFLLTLVIFFFVVVIPQNQALNRLRVQLRSDQEKLDRAEREFTNIPIAEKKISQLKAKYSLLLGKLPAEGNMPEIIKQLSEELGKRDIKLISLVPEIKEAPEEGGSDEITIDVLMQSNYETLGSYLEAVRGLPLVFRIRDIAMEREGIGDLLSIRLVLTTYSLSYE